MANVCVCVCFALLSRVIVAREDEREERSRKRKKNLAYKYEWHTHAHIERILFLFFPSGRICLQLHQMKGRENDMTQKYDKNIEICLDDEEEKD
jgi:hypothetical protein